MTDRTSDRRPPLFVWALLVVMLLNGVSAALLVQTRLTSADYVRCISAWQRDSARAVKARSAAAGITQTAQDALIFAKPKDAEQAFHHYRVVRRHQIATRQRNPLPDYPDKTCGEAP